MIRIFPIRHHSPASSLLLHRVIEQVQPKIILVEGPSDAQHLIEIITDAETLPPVAILAYAFTDAQDAAKPHYLLYPFADYSPEYVALTQAKCLGAEARFVDIPSTVALNWYEGVEQMVSYGDLFETLATRSGHRSFEEFWEAAFENGGLDAEPFIASILDYAHLLRDRAEANPSPQFQKDRYREHVMAQHITAVLEEGYQPEDILLVCGAFHAAAFQTLTSHPPLPKGEGEQILPSPIGRGAGGEGFLLPLSFQEEGGFPSESFGGEFPDPIATELTVIPYSYPRLSEQSGYGAGNRAPMYYQKVYEHNGDFGQASQEMLVTFMNRLHFQGHTVSLANVIEANRLAKVLAAMRDKRAPGLEEVRESLTACLLHGETTLIDEFLWDLLIGRSVGKVSSKIGKSSLQQEFYREVGLRKIPVNDSPQDFILHLTNATEIGTSIFLHRLRISEIPFVRNTATVASAYDYLSQTREKWEVQWTPAVDAALVEQSMLGNSLAEVCTRLLNQKLSAAQNTRDAAEVLLEIAVCDVIGLLPQALRACDALASEDSDVVSLSKACQNLQALLAYGSSRKMPPEEIERMLTHAFNRAVLLLPAASSVSDDGVEALCTALKILSDLAMRAPLVNAELFAEMVADLMDSYTAHPKIAGLAASIAYQAQNVTDDQVLVSLNQRLSAGNSALNGAWFLDGFLSLTRLVLVNNLTLVTLLDAFVQAIHPDEFLVALPVLRRAFTDLSASERNYFLENLGTVHHINQTAAVQEVIRADAETLQDLDDVSQALDDLF